MTREEAIKIIDCYDIGFYDLSGEKIPADKLAEAFDMAIEALSEETSTIQEKHQLSEETSTNTSTNISTDASADRPRGEWTLKMNERFYWKECSVCGHKPPRSDEYGTYIESNYCPNCGAKMDGERSEE